MSLKLCYVVEVMDYRWHNKLKPYHIVLALLQLMKLRSNKDGGGVKYVKNKLKGGKTETKLDMVLV